MRINPAVRRDIGGILRVIRIMAVLLHPPAEKDLQSPICAALWLEAAAECMAIFKGAQLFSLAQQRI